LTLVETHPAFRTSPFVNPLSSLSPNPLLRFRETIPLAIMSKAGGAAARLMSELQQLQKQKWVNVDLIRDNIFRWDIGLIVLNQESAYKNAYLKVRTHFPCSFYLPTMRSQRSRRHADNPQCEMMFTEEYPYAPPSFKFQIPIYHPNVYPDGRVCISILHQPGEDSTSGEAACERWSPLQGVESVLRSVLLLLDDPEISSPAHVDAGVMYRDNRAEYNRKAADTVERSKRDIPAGFVMPTTIIEDAPVLKDADDDFWNEDDELDDFDFGSGTDEEIQDEDEDEENGSDDDES
jgi:ubiquitin-conjugating enzyme E2 R